MNASPSRWRRRLLATAAGLCAAVALAAAALDRGRLVGLAGCSADCGAMWQIGIDVLPEYGALKHNIGNERK